LTAQNSLPTLILKPIRLFAILGLLCASSYPALSAAQSAAQSDAQSATQNSDVFGAEMNSLLSAQQDALSSGDPDQIYKTSDSVAVASLTVLDSLDANDQESRKAAGALSYAIAHLSDLTAERALLTMELRLGDTAPAEELRQHIVKTNPGTAELHLALASIFEQNMKLADAAQEAQRAADLDPQSRDTQIALGMAYWKLNGSQYNEDTLKAFTAAHQIDPDGYSTNLLLGMIESQYQRFDDAAAHLRAAAAANPDAPEPWYQLGMNAYQQSKPAEAGEMLEKFLSLTQAAGKLRPSQVRLALLTLDQIAIDQGQAPDESHKAAEDELKHQAFGATGAQDAPTAAESAPMGAASSGDQPAQRNTASNSPDPATLAQVRALAANALGNIGTVLARKEDFSGAVAAFKYSLAEDPTQEAVTRNLGLAACVSGAYQDGAQALKQSVAAHPEDLTAQACLGMADYEAGQYAEATAAFQTLGGALASQPLFAATAASASLRTGDRGRAEGLLSALNGSNPDPRVQARKATAYLDLGDVDSARSAAQSAIATQNQTPAEAHRVLGLLALQSGDPAKAAAEFQTEINAEPDGGASQPEAQALLTEALSEAGKKAEAEALRQKLARANPTLAGNLLHQGQSLEKSRDPQAAFEKFAAALALAPHDKDTRAAYDAAKLALKKAHP
jgi:Tfp pilus assembly protein PilF